TARTELATTQAGLTQTQTDLATARTELTNVPLDPTYQQMESFLAADKTDRNTYNAATYDCVNFSADVIADAAKSKIRCAYVNIDERDSGHAIVAFNTTDRGLIYIEPQSDEEVNLQVGRHYYQCIIPEPGSYYIPPGYDDTVVRFIVIW
ncbi:MAG: hypothetical protein NTX46_03540, partial [Chloroflexi bacterium]|nr:hypothetical protein [Chloroflexota bacterium]